MGPARPGSLRFPLTPGCKRRADIGRVSNRGGPGLGWRINVRAYRKAHGLSQNELADRLGVDWSYVSPIERGSKNLTLRSVERTAERIGVDPLDLLSFEQCRSFSA